MLKKLDVMDIGLIKLASIFFILWLITLIPALMELVHKINTWIFFVLMLVFSIRPVYKALTK